MFKRQENETTQEQNWGFKEKIAKRQRNVVKQDFKDFKENMFKSQRNEAKKEKMLETQRKDV